MFQLNYPMRPRVGDWEHMVLLLGNNYQIYQEFARLLSPMGMGSNLYQHEKMHQPQNAPSVVLMATIKQHAEVLSTARKAAKRRSTSSQSKDKLPSWPHR